MTNRKEVPAQVIFSIVFFFKCASASRSDGRFGVTWGKNAIFGPRTLGKEFWVNIEISWRLVNGGCDFGRGDDGKRANWSRRGRPILRGGARLLHHSARRVRNERSAWAALAVTSSRVGSYIVCKAARCWLVHAELYAALTVSCPGRN